MLRIPLTVANTLTPALALTLSSATRFTHRDQSTRFVLFIALFWAVAACRSTITDTVTPATTTTVGPTADASVAVQWVDLFLDVERYAPGHRPPVAARALGYISVAAYETVIPGSAEYQSVAPRFAGLTIPKPEPGVGYRPDVAVNEMYYALMKNFFLHVADADKAKIESLYVKLTTTIGPVEEIWSGHGCSSICLLRDGRSRARRLPAQLPH